MPWAALPYERTEIKNKIKSNFGINGIPSIVVLNQNAQIVTEEGHVDLIEKGNGVIEEWLEKA